MVLAQDAKHGASAWDVGEPQIHRFMHGAFDRPIRDQVVALRRENLQLQSKLATGSNGVSPT